MAGSPTEGPITAMKKLDWKYVPVFVIFALSMALAPVFRAQDQGSLTRITPVPADAEYTVDGQTYTQRFERGVADGQQAHLVGAPCALRSGHIGIKYVFRGVGVRWRSRFRPIRLIVTASPAIPEYRAIFDVLYGLAISFFSCADPTHCPGSPGTILGEWHGHTTRSDDVYVAAGSVAVSAGDSESGICLSGMAAGCEPGNPGLPEHGDHEIPDERCIPDFRWRDR